MQRMQDAFTMNDCKSITATVLMDSPVMAFYHVNPFHQPATSETTADFSPHVHRITGEFSYVMSRLGIMEVKARWNGSRFGT